MAKKRDFSKAIGADAQFFLSQKQQPEIIKTDIPLKSSLKNKRISLYVSIEIEKKINLISRGAGKSKNQLIIEILAHGLSQYDEIYQKMLNLSHD